MIAVMFLVHHSLESITKFTRTVQVNQRCQVATSAAMQFIFFHIFAPAYHQYCHGERGSL